MDSEKKIYQIPEFTGENIPLKEAARIMGKDYQFVRLGLIEGILPIGTTYNIFNVGNKEAISVRKWVELCYKVAGKQATFVNV